MREQQVINAAMRNLVNLEKKYCWKMRRSAAGHGAVVGVVIWGIIQIGGW